MKVRMTVVSAALAAGALVAGAALAADINVTLSGDTETPPVNTAAKGGGKITIGDDGAVSGSVMTTGVQGTMAHIHAGDAGCKSPVIVPLTKDGDTYKVPAGAKLTPAQMQLFKDGKLYVNVHSDANKAGEICGPLK